MKTKKVPNILFDNRIDIFFRHVQNKIAIILVASFVFAFLHFSFHNNFDHKHDESCSVYVLEQLFFGADVISISPIFTSFLPFVFSVVIVQIYSFRQLNFFHIRAPPAL